MPAYLPRMARQARAIAFADLLVTNNYRIADTVLKMGVTKNYNSAHVIGHRLLHSVTCYERLQQHMANSKSTADDVLTKLSSIAQLDAEFKGSDIVKCNELLAKHHGLIKERVETADVTESTSTSILAAHIADMVTDSGLNPQIAEEKLQLSMSRKDRKTYRADLDPTVHPELWPSGCLVQKVEQNENISTIEGEQ